MNKTLPKRINTQCGFFSLMSCVVFAFCFVVSVAQASPAQHKFYPLYKTKIEQKAEPQARFIPLARRGGGRALKFVPSGRQAIKLKNKDSVRNNGATAVAPNQARQLLSIYESVD